MNQEGLLAYLNGVERDMLNRRIKSGSSREQVRTRLGLVAKQQVLLVQMTDEHDLATLVLWVGQ